MKSSINFPLILFLLTFFSSFTDANNDEASSASSAIKNLRARYDAGIDTIVVDWEWDEEEESDGGGKQLEDYELFVRYKVSKSNQGGGGSQTEEEWRRVHADEDGLGARIPLGRVLDSDDELLVQVIAEPEMGSNRLSEHSDTLVVWIARRSDDLLLPQEGMEETPQKIELPQNDRSEEVEEIEKSEDSPRPLQQPIVEEELRRGEEDLPSQNHDEAERIEQKSEPSPPPQQQQPPPPPPFQPFPYQPLSPPSPQPTPAALLPPYNFTANILSPTKVQLEWKKPPHPAAEAARAPPFFYIVNVRQMSANSGTRRFAPQQIRVEETHFLFDHLVPGESFEFTLRSALSSERISHSAAIVEITLPKENENAALMDVGNLLVTSRFRPDGHGVVNLTWEVPPQLKGKVYSYEMRYIDAGDMSRIGGDLERWEQLHFPGEAPSAQLYSMRPDTEYLLRIRTTLTSGVQVESGEFRFRTPKVGEQNPLARLDVLYSSELPTVRLQWILASHIQASEVVGYDLRITDRYDLPENEWQFHRVSSGYSPQLSLDRLQPMTTYFVRVDVRKMDGRVLKSNVVYRFTTLENLAVSPLGNVGTSGGNIGQQQQSSGFQQIGSDQVKIFWTFSSAVLLAAKSISIFYSDEPREPLERWQNVKVDSVHSPSSAILSGLRENATYNVQIVPTGHVGKLMWEHAKRLQIRTIAASNNSPQQKEEEKEEEKLTETKSSSQEEVTDFSHRRRQRRGMGRRENQKIAVEGEEV